jgi:hypothetical protein
MRLLFALLVVPLLGAGIGACGGGGDGTGPASQTSSIITAVSGATPTTVAGARQPAVRLKGDEDDDDSASRDIGSSPYDNDADFDNDRYGDGNKGYYDGDDKPIRAYGQAAGTSDKRALAALVERYYAAAAAGDGAAACSVIDPSFAKAIPEDYGQAPGPGYLRGAKTCPAVMTLLFKYFHSQLGGAVEVTGVRVKGDQAFVLLGSTTRPASYLTLKRKGGGAWGIEGLLATPLQ